MSGSQFDPRIAKAEALDTILGFPGYNEIGAQAKGDWVIVWLQTPEDREEAPVVWTGISPEAAMQVGELIARAGHAAQSKEDVYGKTPIVLEQIRQRLVISIEHMLRSADMHDELVPDKLNLIANRAVELALTELGT